MGSRRRAFAWLTRWSIESHRKDPWRIKREAPIEAPILDIFHLIGENHVFLMEAVAVSAEAIVSRDPLPFGIDKIISEDVLGASPFNRQRLLNGIDDRCVPPDVCEMDAQFYGYLAVGLQSRRMPSRVAPIMAVPAGLYPSKHFEAGIAVSSQLE